MSDLDKRITGDWFEIREAFQDYVTLDQKLRIPDTAIRSHIDKLKFSVEQGIVEYKRSCLAPLYRVLESTKYQSLSAVQIDAQLKEINTLLFIVLVQRLLAEGIARFASRQKASEEGIDPDDLKLKDILEDINKRVKTDATAKNKPAVKMILAQVNRYQKEQQTFKELLTTIKEDNKRAVAASFKKTFSEIIDRIKRNYIEILKGEAPPADDNRSLIEVVPLKKSAPIVTSQAKIVSHIKSALNFVQEEKYKTREILVGLGREREAITELFRKEMDTYQGFYDQLDTARKKDVGQKDFASLISRNLGSEMIRYLEKELGFRQSLGAS